MKAGIDTESSCFSFTWMLPCCVVGWDFHIKEKKKWHWRILVEQKYLISLHHSKWSRRKVCSVSFQTLTSTGHFCWRWVRQFQRISQIVSQQQQQSCICAILASEETTELFIVCPFQNCDTLFQLIWFPSLSELCWSSMPAFLNQPSSQGSDILQLRCQSKGGKKEKKKECTTQQQSHQLLLIRLIALSSVQWLKAIAGTHNQYFHPLRSSLLWFIVVWLLGEQ